ncbi:tetratricopeptide repeat protein [Sphingobium limneticum]|uniref:tetratricopeptide repeat protein n=1 Tax=Sphingobium limneticum TaxID=1007511 RepID=UPI003CFDF8FD
MTNISDHRRAAAEDAIRLRRLLAESTDDDSLRVALADKYVVLGHYAAALREYGRALAGEGDADSILGRLAKTALKRGRIEESRGYFDAARTIVPTVEDWPDWLSANNEGASDKIKSEHNRCLILFSGVPPIDLVPICPGLRRDRVSHLARGYWEALLGFGVECRYLSHPEYFADAKSEFGRQCLHLRIADSDDPRILKGARNVMVYTSPVPASHQGRRWPHPFADFTRVLGLFDEIWTPSVEAVPALETLIDVPVKYINYPAPPRPLSSEQDMASDARALSAVPLALFARVQHLMDQTAEAGRKNVADILNDADTVPDRKIFFAVADRHDRRDQLLPLLQGFAKAAAQDPRLLLILLYDLPGASATDLFEHLVSRHLARADRLLETLCSDRIWICNVLPETIELERLLDAADFFLTCPMIRDYDPYLMLAMAQGCVAVSPYACIDEQQATSRTAVLVESWPGGKDLYHPLSAECLPDVSKIVDGDRVARAVTRACSLHPETYGAMRAASKRAIANFAVPDHVTSLAQAIELAVYAMEGRG